MNKLTNILYLFLCIFCFAACDSSDAPANGYIATTEDSSSSLVLKGYEGGNLGFSVFQPTGFDKPFYIKNQKFTGTAFSFIKSDAMESVSCNSIWRSFNIVSVEMARCSKSNRSSLSKDLST